MPTYVYKFVDTGETIEIQQSFTDDTLTEAVHPASGKAMAVKKVFQPVGVTFKGDGFYKTDSRAKKGSKNGSKNGSSSTSADSSASNGSTSGSTTESKSDSSSKPAATSSSGTSTTSSD